MPDQSAPWFAAKDGSLWVFRVNRRPLAKPDLFTPDIPPDVFDHFVRTLAPGYPVKTGRRHQRRWRVGGVEVDHNQSLLVGKLGWQSLDEESVPEWSDEESDWTTSTTGSKGGRVVPFGFDGETRLLTVLRDATTPAGTVAGVFEGILRGNERELRYPSTDWSVEPILNTTEFLAWVESVDTLQFVSFTAKLPNPSPDEGFADIFERMEARRATVYREELRSDAEEGLIGIQEDDDVRQAIAMGERGFATLRGKGHRSGSETRYSQTDQVARQEVEDLPANWDDVFGVVKRYLRGVLRRFLPPSSAPAPHSPPSAPATPEPETRPRPRQHLSIDDDPTWRRIRGLDQSTEPDDSDRDDRPRRELPPGHDDPQSDR